MGLFNIRVMGLEMCIFQGKPLELVHDNPPPASGLKGHGFSIATFEKTVGLSHFRKWFSAGWWFGACFIFPYIGNNHPIYWLKPPSSQDLNGFFSFPNDFAPVFWTSFSTGLPGPFPNSSATQNTRLTATFGLSQKASWASWWTWRSGGTCSRYLERLRKLLGFYCRMFFFGHPGI